MKEYALKKRYGRLVVDSAPFIRLYGMVGRAAVSVRCECGGQKIVRVDHLMYGKTKSCGCLSDEIKKKLKNRHGMLTVVSSPYRRDDLVGRAMYVDVLCDCGAKKSVKAISLKSGVTKSCGCLSAKVAIRTHTTHGLSKHPLMKIWSGIIQRCTNKKSKAYKGYGAVGVRVCKLWLNSYIDFYKWAIKKGWQKGMDVDKDKIPIQLGISERVYSPKMCSILTRKENLKYKRTCV